MARQDDGNRVIDCPRCGYDQRGVIEAWRESCPLDGVCSECGLAYAWGELLNPALTHPRWCVEHRGGFFRYPLQVVGTLMRTYWPWSLWSGLRMTHKPRWRRLAAHLAALALCLAVLMDLTVGFGAVISWRSLFAGPSNVTVTTSATAWDVFQNAALHPFSDKTQSMSVTITWTSQLGGSSTVTISTSGSSTVALSPRWGVSAIAPLSVLEQVLQSVAPLLMLGMTPPFMGAAFAALPVSRRLAKVRWRHVVRATCYSMGLASMPIAIVLSVMMWPGMFAPRGSSTQAPGPAILLTIPLAIAFIPLQTAFWSTAAGRYLKMQHAWAVGVSVVIIGLLCPFALGSLIMNGL